MLAWYQETWTACVLINAEIGYAISTTRGLIEAWFSNAP